MNDSVEKHDKHVKPAKVKYEVFCKLHARNTINKRGSVICREADDYYTPEKAVTNFFKAIIKANELTALERIILVALRDLSTRQIRDLKQRLKACCVQEDVVGV